MAEKNIKSRIVHKHDTESNWSKATTFIPKQGEIIIYDIDSNHSYERFKIGDGITKVNNLPFADANKVDKISGKGLSTNDYTTAEKNKLASIAEGANKTIVDSELSSTSTDPVQNKVVNAAINDLNTLVGDTAVATQISNAVASKADASHTHDDRYYTESEIDTKLSGKSDTSHTHSAYVNQNAFSNIKVGNTTVAADTATDTVTLVAGNNITITPDATNDKVTIAATDTVYTHPSSGVTVGTYKSVTVNAQGHVTGGSNPTTLSGYGITDAATKSALTAVSDLVGDTAVSAQISDYAAPKSHTHSYLPLSGGTVTGTLTVNKELYSNAAVISKRNSNPQLILQNASGANLAMLYSNGTNGGYSNAVLRVYSSASEYSSFSFGKDGQFTAPNDINTEGGLYAKGGIFSTTNAYPGLKIRDASYKQLALLQSNTANGGYSDFVIGVASKEDAWRYFTFKTNGIFGAPSDIISNGGILKSSRNTNPCLALTNQAGAWLASLAATTSDGSYGNTQLAVYKSATESSTFTFSNQGSFRAPNTVYSSLFAVQSNNNPQIALQNNNGANLGILYMNTTYGLYTNACLRVYASATSYSSFNFGNDGKLSCGSLALTTALPISSGGTGATTASAALSNLGAAASNHNHDSVYYKKSNIVYSSTQPTGSTGMIWLKPV